MIVRESRLPPGWYPGDKRKIEEFLRPFTEERDEPLYAAVVPHAGWYYSGACAAKAVSLLDPEADTVAVIGGHLPPGTPVLLAEEEGVITPLGPMRIDLELREAFAERIPVRPDRYQDNTVEVLLPMVRYFLPNSALLWLRFPAELSSFEAGKLLKKTASGLGRRLAVLASTDLTHYGPNYGFSPRGRGNPALDWVKNVNDAAFIKAVLEGEPSLVLKRASEDSSACSCGAVLGALGFAGDGARGRLLDYRTSADVMSSDDGEVPDSFVGYAAIAIA
jgi:AmmeMemoRadiSam system protein B